MSQWSEKFPKENLSETFSSTRYFFTSFSKAWIQINNFRKSSKKFIINLLTKNVALNLSGALFFVGLGYSLKWWYKDQLFVVLLRQNLPALSKSQQNIYWETGDLILNDENETLTPHISLIDCIDLYANQIDVKFKQPWQKHVSEQFIGVFGEPAQANGSKQVLTTKEKDWENINTYLLDQLKKNPTPFYLSPLNRINTKILKESENKQINNFAGSLYNSKRVINVVNTFSTYTLYGPKKPIFPKKWFKLSPRNLYFLNQEVILPLFGTKPRSFSLHTPSGVSTDDLSITSGDKKVMEKSVTGCRLWRSKHAKQKSFSRSQIFTNKLSYPLQLTKKLTGWQPCPNLLVLNSSLDEIPSKLENVLQPYFPKKDLQLLFLSTSFRKSINSLAKQYKSSTAINSVNTLLGKTVASCAKQPSQAYTPKAFTHALPPQGFYPYGHTSYAQLSNWQSKEEVYLLPHALQYVQSKASDPGTEVKAFATPSFTNPLHTPYGISTRVRNTQSKEKGHTFLVPIKQSETYLKKLHLFETKKLLKNQLVLLINSFPIDLVENNKYAPYPEKVSHALKDSNVFVPSKMSNEFFEKEILLPQQEDLSPKVMESLLPQQLATQTQRGVENNLFETNDLSPKVMDGFITNNKFSINYVNSYPLAIERELHHLVDVTKKVLEVKRNTGIILPPSVQIKAQYLPHTQRVRGTQSKATQLRKPVGIKALWDKQSEKGLLPLREDLSPKVIEGTKIDRLTQLFAYSTVANAADDKGLDPLLLLNSLGFTFNNFSPLTNPPILLSYDKLGVGLANISKTGSDNNSPTVQILSFKESERKEYLENDSLLQQQKKPVQIEEAILLPQQPATQLRVGSMPVGVKARKGIEILKEDLSITSGDKKVIESKALLCDNTPLLYELLCVAKEPYIFDLYRSISFYFNPKNLNWVVFQRSTNEKFNLLLKKIASELNKEITNTGLITSNQPLTPQLIHLMFEFLKGRVYLSYVYPFPLQGLQSVALQGFAKELSTLLINNKKEAFTHYLYEQSKEEVAGDSLLQPQKLSSKVIDEPVVEKAKTKKLIDLIKTNTVINKLNRFTTISNVNKISFKETKIETLDKINVVDKNINFDKNSRYMSGYVYPDIQNNSLQAFLYQWYAKQGKNKNLMPRFSSHSHYLNEKPCNAKPLLQFAPAQLLQISDLYSRPFAYSLTQFVNTIPSTAMLSSGSKHKGYRKCQYNVYPLRELPPAGARELPPAGARELLPAGARELPLASARELPYGISSSLMVKKDIFYKGDQFLGNNHYMGNREVPYKKFNHYLAKFPGFSDPNQFLKTLPQISCGHENVINDNLSCQQSAANPQLLQLHFASNMVDKSEITKEFIQKNGCDFRKIAYSGIGVRRNKWTKDFQPFISNTNKDCKKFLDGASNSSSSNWGTLFLGPENPLTDCQCHFFGQKQLSTLDTNSLQRDYLRQLGKEILIQSNSKGYTELSKVSSIERTKILSLSKKVNSFFFKKRKYSYLLEPKDQWHLLFQEQLCTALEDGKKYPVSTIHSFEETNMEKLKLGSGRIKVSAPLVMARFPKKLVQSPSIHNKLASYQLEQGISWRPFCQLQKSFIYAPLKYKDLLSPSVISPPAVARENQSFTSYNSNNFRQNLDYYHISFTNPVFTPRHGCFNKTVSSEYSGFYPYGYTSYAQLSSWANCTNLISTTQRFARRLIPFVGELVQQAHYPHYPLFTERFSEEINAVPGLNKNFLFYSATNSSARLSPSVISPAVARETSSRATPPVVAREFLSPKVISPSALARVKAGVKTQKGRKTLKNNLLGIQNICTSFLVQEPLNCNSWAVLNQWVFLIALLFWVEQTLLNNVFPALFALEQILLSAAGLTTGENNRIHVLRISKNETPKFQNLAGIDGLLGELSELVLFLRGQQNLGFWNKWNKKNSYGVLLTGSPGTGKTFLVRALANEAKVPVLILSASTLTTNKFNNNKPSWSIRHAFKRAKQLAPCILFIDEIDALGKSRGKIVTDINEIVADTNLTSLNASFLAHKRMLTKSIPHSSASPIGQQIFSYEQFGQNCSNFNATLLNKWEYPLQSTILHDSNQINQNSLCQEKLFDLLKIAGRRKLTTALPTGGTHSVQDRKGSGAFTSSPSGKESAAEENINETSFGVQELPTLEKEMTRGKFGPLTQLLVSMDGVSSFSGVLIMGATNRPELLDPALTRPGRFEKIIRIDKPSEQNRIEILQLYSQNLGVQQPIPWSYLATRTIGLTTADLAVAMNYSSLRAIIQNSVHTLETIEYGLNCITRL